MTRRLIAVLLAPAAALVTVVTTGCGAGAPEEATEADTAEIRGAQPRLSHLPDVTGIVMGGCENRLSGCSLRSTNGRNALLEARRIYDEIFLPQRPTTEAGWGWRVATADEVATIDGRPPILPLPVGAARPTKEDYKAWMALRPDPWEAIERRKVLASVTYTARTTLPFSRNRTPIAREDNRDVLARHAADGELPATDRLRARYYEEQDPFDWQAAAMTHYQAPSALRATDIMATNFIWRVLLAPYQMEQALADCTSDPAIPCIDSVAALSDADLYKVYDVRFVRTPEPGRVEVSRTFRVVSVDSGHAIDLQSTFGPAATDAVTGAPTPGGNSTPFLKTYGGAGPTLLWRLELGGQLANTLNGGSGALPGLVRYASVNGRTRADRPAPDSCTDVNEGEWKCVAENGRSKTLKCMGLLWQTYAFGCRIPGRPATP